MKENVRGKRNGKGIKYIKKHTGKEWKSLSSGLEGKEQQKKKKKFSLLKISQRNVKIL